MQCRSSHSEHFLCVSSSLASRVWALHKHNVVNNTVNKTENAMVYDVLDQQHRMYRITIVFEAPVFFWIVSAKKVEKN